MLHCTPGLCTLTDWPSVLRHPTAPLIKPQAGGRSGGSTLQSRPAAPSMCGWSLRAREPWCKDPRGVQGAPAAAACNGPLQCPVTLPWPRTPAACNGTPRRCAHPLPCPGKGHREPHNRAGQGKPPGKASKGQPPGAQQGSTDGDAGEVSTSPSTWKNAKSPPGPTSSPHRRAGGGEGRGRPELIRPPCHRQRRQAGPDPSVGL